MLYFVGDVLPLTIYFLIHVLHVILSSRDQIEQQTYGRS
jgi:hypothetical protein